jgi:hypothetical protein
MEQTPKATEHAPKSSSKEAQLAELQKKIDELIEQREKLKGGSTT